MEYSSIVQQVVDKGKRGAAEHIQNCQSPELLYQILDRILNHEISINDNESIDWIKWLMAGGKTPDEFTAIVKRYNNATTCGLVWTAQFVAYRCRTCGISPCMSLCAECFVKGQHEGHDFNMFRSQAGGACDCGDTSVMRSTGFCDKHGIIDDSERMKPPAELLYVAELMIPRIFFRLILHLRNKRNPLLTSSTEVPTNFEADDFLTMLSELSGMGAAMRRVLTSALTNKEVYQKITQEWARDDTAYAAHLMASEQSHEEALKSLGNPDPPPEFIDCPGLKKELQHSTFLEELVFWTVKYEFPQKVVCFLLNMLPDVRYKEALTEAFVIHYSRIAMVLEKSKDPDTLSNRVVHVSVQLFSNEKLAIRMTEKFCLLQVMVVSLKNMMSRILISMPLNSCNQSFNIKERPRVVNCGLSVMKEHCYWPLVSDLNNVLSHRPVAVQFMCNETLTNMWFSFLSYFQGMNINQRELNQHIEFEPNTYYAAFSAELEASAYPMWALLSHLNTNESTIPLTKRMLSSCLAALEEWIVAVSDSFDDNQVSFHIPLHRYLATFICQAVNVQHLPLSEVLPRDDLIPSIILHPLRIQVAFYEIVNSFWIRNGLQIRGQAMTYIQCNFCSSMVDADLYLLQILATQIPVNEFMQIVIKKFHIKDWLNFYSNHGPANPINDSDSDMSMLESFLVFLATLCSNRTNLGIEYYDKEPKYPVLTRLEMVTLLCANDRTHSQLMEAMPERCGTGQSRDFDTILSQIAEYRPPNFEAGGNMQQGLYIPKACVWEELYDPIHVLLRAVNYRKDFQNSMDRYTEFVKQSNLLPPKTVPWPPFRIPKSCNPKYKDPRCILHDRIFHEVIWTVLYKAVHSRNGVSEHILSLAVYLLEMALTIPPLPTQTQKNNVEAIGLDSFKSYIKMSNANENTISLLLKLHSQLSRYPNSFNPDNVNYDDLDLRIGDGVFFIGKVLTRIVKLDEMCRRELLTCRENLWPRRLYNETPNLDVDEREQRRRMALERQQMFMESFANMRNEFIRRNIDVSGEVKMDWEGCDPSQTHVQVTQRKYDCVICNQSWPSTEERPMGLVVLVQATSVLGHKRKHAERAVLPTNDEDRVSSFYCDTLANDFEKKVEELSREFDQLSWWQSINLGWEGGIHVQTCGHHLHLDCLTSYQNSLLTQPRVVDRFELKKGEYLCPLCRRLANSFLPMPLDHGENIAIASRQDDMASSILKIANLIMDVERANLIAEVAQPTECSSMLMDAMKQSMKDMTESTYPKFLQRCDPTQVPTFFLFVTSIARTNLEIDIVQRGGSLMKPSSPSSSRETLSSLIPQRSCIMPLLHVLATHARMLAHPPVWKTWQQLTGVSIEQQNMIVLSSKGSSVPLLLRDPVALLIQFVLLLPLNMDQTYYMYIVKFLYNLLYFQVVAQLSCHLKEAERNHFRVADINLRNTTNEFSLDHAMKLIVEWMSSVQLYLEDGNDDSVKEPAYETLELKIQEMCLPFLRVASILRHYMYNEELPAVLVEADEFVRLVYYLELVSHGMERSKFNSAVVLTWPDSKVDTIDFWFKQFSCYVNRSQIAARNFLAELHVPWKQPKLLKLPEQYDKIFKYYHTISCSCCHSVPLEGSICLVCGTLVCFKQDCCQRNRVHEAVQFIDYNPEYPSPNLQGLQYEHAIDCGAGTSMFLVFTSSCVIVVRGRRACVWGSIYLDKYGEEDRELKRGKPLRLSQERYKLLERQWLSHSFDHTPKKWIFHRDGL